MTVMALARQEPEHGGCCDTRSTLWNGVCRDLAHEELSKATRAVGDHAGVDFEVLEAPVGNVVDVVAQAAAARDADEIVLADPRRAGSASSSVAGFDAAAPSLSAASAPRAGRSRGCGGRSALSRTR